MSGGDAGAALPTVPAIEAAVAAVLARPEFSPPAHGPLRQLLDWLRDQLRLVWRLIRDFLPPLREAFGVPWAAEAMLAVLASLLAVVLVRHLHRLRRAVPRAPARDVGPEDTAPEAAGALRAAAEAAASGRWHDAAHALYVGAVLWLDAAGTVRWDPAATGGDYCRVLAGGPHAAAFGALVAAFYPLAYGDRPDAAGAYARMRTAATALGVPA